MLTERVCGLKDLSASTDGGVSCSARFSWLDTFSVVMLDVGFLSPREAGVTAGFDKLLDNDGDECRE